MTLTRDHLKSTDAKIPKRYTPMHHDPMEINYSVADAPSALIMPAGGGPGARGGA